MNEKNIYIYIRVFHKVVISLTFSYTIYNNNNNKYIYKGVIN